VTIYLVRHGRAGERRAWRDDDTYRPLSARGHIQARGLTEILADAVFDRVLSSPYVRCMESVVPLASTRGLAIEPVDALAEGADLEDVLTLIRKHAVHGAVLCTHGDVIPMALAYYAESGVEIGKRPRWPKGCTWVLDTDGTGEVRAAEYLPPPA
jgi:broad specificity phosphatase PhoE